MRYAVAIGYPLRLYVERDRAVQEIERQDCRVTLSSEQAMQWGGLSMWRELREEEKPAAERRRGFPPPEWLREQGKAATAGKRG